LLFVICLKRGGFCLFVVCYLFVFCLIWNLSVSFLTSCKHLMSAGELIDWLKTVPSDDLGGRGAQPAAFCRAPELITVRRVVRKAPGRAGRFVVW
jgi:hypothetical protein